MANKKMPFDVRNVKTAAATTETIDLFTVDPGYIVAVQLASAVDVGHATTQTRFFKKSPESTYMVAQAIAPASGTALFLTTTIYLTEGQTLTIEYVGCTVADVLSTFVTGWRSKYEHFDPETI